MIDDLEELFAEVETDDAKAALHSLQDAESCETFDDFKANIEEAETRLKEALDHVRYLKSLAKTFERKQVSK